MKKLRILVDMNLSPAWIQVLSSAGFMAVHWSQIGAGNASDEVLFQWAKNNGHIVFTHDLDFGAILAATNADAPSVFQVRTTDVSPGILGERVCGLLEKFTPQLLTGALLVIDDLRDRIRILPFN